jgi:hypothetical protein
MRLAQEAAMAAARTLDGEDRVAVIAFNDRATWIAPFQSAAHQGTLRQQVRSMEAQGGTNFYPALKDGIESILKQRCGIRHIVLLTDGVTRTAVFSNLVTEGARQGVTLSTVAVGDGADTRLLGLLAGWGRGKLYLALDPQRLPAIVTLDSKTFDRDVRDQAVKNDQPLDVDVPTPPERDDPGTDGSPTTDDGPREAPGQPQGPPLRFPRTVARAAALAGFEQVTWPPLAHAEDVRLRPGAHAPLAWTPTDATPAGPALILGRALLGRSVVLAADVSGSDARDFQSWERSGAFLAQLVRSVDPPPQTPVRALRARFVETLADGNGPAAFVQIPGVGSGRLSLATVRSTAHPKVTELAAQVRARSGGALAELDEMPARGVYAGLLEDENGTLHRVLGVSPGPRGGPHGPGRVHRSLEHLAHLSGLRLRRHPPERPISPERERRNPVPAPFLLGALFFLLLESAWRRVART